MSRDGSGTYTLPTNSFAEPVANTAISPTDATTTLNDLATELTDSLSRSGKGGMSADLDMNNNDINELKTAVFQGSTSGNTTVIATAIAGTTTLTLPAATDTLIAKATTDILTNKTLDTAGTGNVLKINGVTISANTGTGSNVLGTSPTITKPNLVGTATNDSAAAGSIGEYKNTDVAVGSAVSLTTATPKDMASVSLTAGDWDVSINLYFNPAASTSITALIASISQTVDTRDTTTMGAEVGQRYAAFVPTTSMNILVGPLRISLSATTTIHAVAQANFTVSTMGVYGQIRARRLW